MQIADMNKHADYTESDYSFSQLLKHNFWKRAPFSENIKHKTSASCTKTFYKTSNSSCKMKLLPQNRFTCAQNQTLLSNHKQSDQMVYTIKQSVNNTPKNRKPVQNIFIREKYIFNLKTNFIFFHHCLLTIIKKKFL